MGGALYAMNFLGMTGTGGGAVYIGNGKILGIDVGNLRYNGTYTETAGRLKASVTMSAPTGALLVTGAQLPAGSQLKATADWPINFADTPQQILIEGKPVHVSFEKIGDI
jgi:hypothetical protein